MSLLEVIVWVLRTEPGAGVAAGPYSSGATTGPWGTEAFFGPQVTGTSAWPSGPDAVAGACESETASGLWMLEADPSGQNPLPVIR